ncbi:MAG: hypothetical protein K8S98_03685 [Planctomycetes bacterium]|nr:hypothetical protein [Planctomycetota bacterium]
MTHTFSRLVVGLVVSTFTAVAASAQASLQAIGPANSFGYGVSRDGSTVVGLDGLASGINFRWTSVGGYSTIGGQSIAVHCSSDGSVIGGSDTPGGQTTAGYWTSLNGWTTVGGLIGQSGSSVSDTWDISHDGQTLVGLGWINAGTAHAFKWTLPTGVVDLGSTGASSRANGVSGDGAVVVGWDDNPSNGTRRPAYWTTPGSPIVLSASPGEAQAADTDGSVIVGQLGSKAFRRTAINGLFSLGALVPTDTSSATDVDDVGATAVGYSGPFGPLTVRRAFVWRAGLGLVDLKTLLTAQGVNTTGWTLYSAIGVSGDGDTITGYAQRPGAGLGAFVAQLASGPGSGSTYCTAKTNSLGCVPIIVTTGIASASVNSGFTIGAADVLSHRSGLFFYGTTGQQAVPFQGGTLCIKPPIKRTSVQNSGGNPSPANDCTGTYSFDFNAYIALGLDPNLTAGQAVDGQFWSRDVGFASPNNTGLTAAVHFVLQP